MREQLQICKSDYQDAKGDFLRIRDRIRTEQFGDHERETTRLYLNASVCYMIAQLEYVQYNLNNSNGSGKDERIPGIENRIIQLKAEQENIEDAEDIEDFSIVAKSVHGTWNNARKDAAFGAGQTVSERLDKSIDKSEALSGRLDGRVHQLNENGVDTTELEDKLILYNGLIGYAREKHTEANVIYQNEKATEEDLDYANDLLHDSLDNVNEANQVLKDIFNELKQYGIGDQDPVKQQDKDQDQDRDQDQVKQQDKDQIQDQDQIQSKAQVIDHEMINNENEEFEN